MTTALQQEVESLKKEVQELRTDIKDLVIAWNTAKGMTTFVKWLAGLATAIIFLWGLTNHGAPK